MAAAAEAAVRQAAAAFHEALNAMLAGDPAPMAAVWSHADDVIYMGPDGAVRIGWDQVRASWQTQAAMRLGGELRPAETRVVLGEDLAITHGYIRGHNLDAHGTRREVSIRETNLFRKEDGAWKMVANHSDPLPFLKPQAL
jgi:uncharacterized protein (TIGR02246 family)